MRKVQIDLNAVAHNFRTVKEAAGNSRIIAVVKSDAYGHGMIEVARLLSSMGAWGFGLAELDEVERLHKAGIGGVKLLMAGVEPGMEADAVGLNAHCAVFNRAQLDRLDKAASSARTRARVHLKIDTGMGRFGFAPNEALDVLRSRSNWPNVEFVALFTHLSSSDDPSHPATRCQLENLDLLLQRLRSCGLRLPLVHAANSAAVFNFPESRYDAVRPGIALYGGMPADSGHAPADPRLSRLRPAMRFSTRIVSVKRLPAGTAVGYGCAYTTPADTTVAVIPVGYDDGYLRALSNRAQVLVNGVRCPVVGNVCMKATMIDVSKVDGVDESCEVVLLGRQGDDEITPGDLASWAGTISYELLCLLGTRNPRSFSGPVQDAGERMCLE